MNEFNKYYTGIYLKGYPGLGKENFKCNITFGQNELNVSEYYSQESKIIFSIPYDKIENFTVESKKEFDGKKSALGFFLLGGIGALAMSQKVQKIFTFIVKGKDKEGNIVKIPIYFANIKNDIDFKEELLKHIHTPDEDITI